MYRRERSGFSVDDSERGSVVRQAARESKTVLIAGNGEPKRQVEPH